MVSHQPAIKNSGKSPSHGSEAEIGSGSKNLNMVSPPTDGAVDIKNRGKSQSHSPEAEIGSSSYTNRNNNRLAPQGQLGQLLSKSQPDPSFQNKLSSSLNGIIPSSYSGPGPYHAIDIPKERQAKIIKRHLVTGDDLAHSYESNGISPEPTYFGSASHKLPGGDATHEVYKWHMGIENEPMKRTRSRSLYIPRPPSDPDTSNIREPGGFRRHHVLMKARKEGKQPNIITRNFIDFLTLVDHFAGEDLSDDEEGEFEDIDPETAPLIPREYPRESHANASPSKAVFLLLKSFVGTGVMFLPKAFYNGGMAFSTLFLIAIAAISLCAFLLLVKTRFYVPYSFGDIGGALYGRWMRLAVLFSITISQIGFVCAYMIFVAKNIGVVVKEVIGVDLDLLWYIAGQIIIFAPLAMIRRISRLSFTALIADAFIMFGLLYLYYYDIITLSHNGVGNIAAFNPDDFALFIGTAVFTFEGIGLIIPITESMKEPEKFPKVLTGVMIFITFIFTSIGIMSYAAFGDQVEDVVILNLPPEDKVVQAVQLLYALAILLSIPLQLFPAIRIMEQGLFSRSGKEYYWVKWQKNVFRFLTVVVCAIISYAGSTDPDKFVALIGSLACVPLCFLYPPLFHIKAAAHTLKAKLLDAFIFLFGLFSLIYTTYITIDKWGNKK